MKIISIIALPVFLLSVCMAIAAAQDPVQEPIPELQWQRAGFAFMLGLYPHAGAESFVNQLAPDVAREIVKLAKPKEYGFIKNFVDNPIVYLKFNIAGLSPLVFFPVIFTYKNSLASQHQIPFFIFDTREQDRDSASNYFYIDGCGRQNYWIPGLNDMLFNVCVELLGEPRMLIENVRFSLFMNFKFYKEDQRIRLEVAAPDHGPVSYYAEPLER